MMNVSHRGSRKKTPFGSSGSPGTEDKDMHFSPSSSLLAKLPAFLVFWRVLSVPLCVHSFLAPDEYFQSLEVAHRMVFGYGYLTWEWKEAIRGYTYPMFIAALYKLLALLGLDTPLLLIYTPHLAHALLTALSDWYLFKLVLRLYGNTDVALWTMVCQATSWWMIFLASRTLTNPVEGALTTIALYYYPLEYCTDRQQTTSLSSRWTYIAIAALACILRSTAGIVWFPLCLLHLLCSKSKAHAVFVEFLPVCALALAWSLLVDRLFYGRWVLVQYNFIYLNSIHAEHFGIFPWYWYLVEGLPAVMGPHLLPFLLGVWKSWRRQKFLLAIIVWTITVYSFQPHKEMRFLHIITPLAMCFCGEGVCYALNRWKNLFMRYFMVFLGIFSIGFAVFLSAYHQVGTIAVMSRLQSCVARYQSDLTASPASPSVLFLMPCHSTPYYSHLHQNITMRFLECPPNLDLLPNYIEEAQLFYSDPIKWLDTEYPSNSKSNSVGRPTFIIIYDILFKQIEIFLERNNYSLCQSFFHTYFPIGKTMGNNVLLFSNNLEACK